MSVSNQTEVAPVQGSRSNKTKQIIWTMITDQ